MLMLASESTELDEAAMVSIWRKSSIESVGGGFLLKRAMLWTTAMASSSRPRLTR